MSVISELGDRLRYKHVEPVQRFRLVRIDIVVRLSEDSGCGEPRRVPEDVRPLAVNFMRSGDRGVDGSVAVGEGPSCGGSFRGWRVTEDEEFYEGAKEYYNGELTEKKPFRE